MKCLVIPDIHQDVGWVERVLSDNPEVRNIIFLGDYFDSTAFGNTKKTCNFLIDLHRDRRVKAVFLIGDHDLQYIEYSLNCAKRYHTKRDLSYRLSSFSKKRAACIHKLLNLKENMMKSEVFKFHHVFEDILFSHAGAAIGLLKYNPDLRIFQKNDNLNQILVDKMKVFTNIGESSGGRKGAVGGLLCFHIGDLLNPHYTDLLKHQISGHDGALSTVRVFTGADGHKFCNLDGRQTTYGILEDGILTIKTTEKYFTADLFFANNTKTSWVETSADFETLHVNLKTQ